MKTTSITLSFSAAAALCIAGAAQAHTVTGTLGTAAGATDLYAVTCSNDGNGDTAKMQFSIVDSAPVAAPLVSATAYKSSRAANTTDAIDGDAGGSPVATVVGVNGVYYVTATKSAAGGEAYTLNFHCITSTGVHTGTTSTLKQNQ